MVSVKQGNKLSGLEVIRGYAALSVVIFHLMVIYAPLPAGVSHSIIRSLSGAVPLFFALSAFSLLYGYRDKIFTEGGLSRFYLRRVFRIIPLFYVMIGIYLAGSVILHGKWVSGSEILINLLFLFPFFPGMHESLVWAGWSLGVEWCFYMLFPFIAVISKCWKLSAVLFLVVSFISISAPGLAADLGLAKTFASASFPRNLIYFQSGVMIFALMQRLADLGRIQNILLHLRGNTNTIFFLTVAILVAHRFSPFSMVQSVMPSEFLFAIVCCVWISLAFAGLPLWIDNRLSRFFGKLSYSIYLLHSVVLWFLSATGVYKSIYEVISNAYLGYLVCVFVTIPLVLLASNIAYHLVEFPGIVLGDRIINLNQRLFAGHFEEKEVNT